MCANINIYVLCSNMYLQMCTGYTQPLVLLLIDDSTPIPAGRLIITTALALLCSYVDLHLYHAVKHPTPYTSPLHSRTSPMPCRQSGLSPTYFCTQHSFGDGSACHIADHFPPPPCACSSACRMDTFCIHQSALISSPAMLTYALCLQHSLIVV
jgi:hypothetical protein